MKDVIPVFFASDDRYAPYLSAALVSLMENADRGYTYELYVLNSGLSGENRARLTGLVERENARGAAAARSCPAAPSASAAPVGSGGSGAEIFRLHFVSMQEKLREFHDKVSNRLRCDYFTLTIYFRLFIPDMFPQYDKGLYLDSDIVVPGDISKLYSEDLRGKMIGACIDLSIQDAPPLCRYIDEAVGVDHRRYVNSGVLLMDLRRLREARFGENFLRLLNTWHFDSVAPDQDYLNAMLAGQICFLDNRWDLFPAEGQPEAEEPLLIHYNLFAKPWLRSGLPYESYFWKYLAATPYYEEVLSFRDSYSDEQKAEDARSMAGMAERALEIVEKGTRFADVPDVRCPAIPVIRCADRSGADHSRKAV